MSTLIQKMRHAAPIALSLMLLGGMAVDRARLAAPQRDAGAYHRQVKASAASAPYRVGDWIGRDIPVPTAASEKLKPNLLISREYQHLRTGERAALLIVQCRDARDLLGHYPPVCYVASGWTNESSRRRDMQVDDLTIRGTEYVFERQVHGRTVGQHVINFMLLPDGRTAADMDAVDAVAQDHRRKFFGAAQVQLLTDVQMPRGTRQRVLRELIGAHAALFEAIHAGESRADREEAGTAAAAPALPASNGREQ